MLCVFADLTPEQQKLLIEIRKKKQELLLEIQVSVLFVCFLRCSFVCLISAARYCAKNCVSVCVCAVLIECEFAGGAQSSAPFADAATTSY